MVEAERWSRGGKGERLLEGLVCEGSHVPPGGGACQALGVPEEGLVQKTDVKLTMPPQVLLGDRGP